MTVMRTQLRQVGLEVQATKSQMWSPEWASTGPSADTMAWCHAESIQVKPSGLELLGSYVDTILTSEFADHTHLQGRTDDAVLLTQHIRSVATCGAGGARQAAWTILSKVATQA